MKITQEINSIEDFDAWQGGLQRKTEIIEAELVDEYNAYLEEILPEEGVTDTHLNDILWFETDDWLQEQYKQRLQDWFDEETDDETREALDRIGFDKLEEHILEIYGEYPMFIDRDVREDIQHFIINNPKEDKNDE
jgi:hypothetical protein